MGYVEFPRLLRGCWSLRCRTPSPALDIQYLPCASKKAHILQGFFFFPFFLLFYFLSLWRVYTGLGRKMPWSPKGIAYTLSGFPLRTSCSFPSPFFQRHLKRGCLTKAHSIEFMTLLNLICWIMNVKRIDLQVDHRWSSSSQTACTERGETEMIKVVPLVLHPQRHVSIRQWTNYPAKCVSKPIRIFHCFHWAAWRSGPSGNVPPAVMILMALRLRLWSTNSSSSGWGFFNFDFFFL